MKNFRKIFWMAIVAVCVYVLFREFYYFTALGFIDYDALAPYWRTHHAEYWTNYWWRNMGCYEVIGTIVAGILAWIGIRRIKKEITKSEG